MTTPSPLLTTNLNVSEDTFGAMVLASIVKPNIRTVSYLFGVPIHQEEDDASSLEMKRLFWGIPIQDVDQEEDNVASIINDQRVTSLQQVIVRVPLPPPHAELKKKKNSGLPLGWKNLPMKALLEKKRVDRRKTRVNCECNNKSSNWCEKGCQASLIFSPNPDKDAKLLASNLKQKRSRRSWGAFKSE